MGNTVDLDCADVLLFAEQEDRFVYFPSSGLISLIASVDNHPAIEVALIGKEGMLDSNLFTEKPTPLLTPLLAVVQGEGSALKISIAAFHQELLGSAELRLAVEQYFSPLLAQITNTAACSSFHAVGPRLAKRLLMAHDRSEVDSMQFTHRSLAGSLGVRRSAITIAAGLLQRQNCISYSRGRITIIDRAALEAASCSCYKPMAV
jgi:CRP-like cAMP-binding protein